MGGVSRHGGVSRRAFVGGVAAGAAALVTGLDPVSRRWVGPAEASSCGGVVGVPPLDGQLLLDLASREAVRTDQGVIADAVPRAVLRPGSVRDVVKMVRWARRCGVPVAARGNHHTVHGQGLTDGLIIEMRALRRIHEVGPQGAWVDAGVLWSELTGPAFAQGLRRPGLTGYTELTVGGVIAVGGVPMPNRVGAVIDTVRELEVVTGEGRLVTCSETRERDLFEAVLGGLGQYGIVVRARVDLVPAATRARTFLLTYAQPGPFFQDFRTLLDRGEFSEVYNVGFPPGSSRPAYQLWATTYYDPPAQPSPLHLLRGLQHPPAAPVLDQDFVEFTRTVDKQVATLQAVGWDRMVKPWYDVWLSGSTVERHVTEVMAELTPEDVGPTGFTLLFASERRRMTRPFFRLPPEDGERFVFLFDVLGASATQGPDPAYAARMVARNRRWFDRAAALGATRYPIGALDFRPEDWARHYGPLWPEAQRRKQRYDPAGILTPGPGVFA